MQGFIWKPFPVGNLSKCTALTHQSAKGLGNTEWKGFLIHVDIYLASIVSFCKLYVCSSELVLDNCCFEQREYCWVLICTAQRLLLKVKQIGMLGIQHLGNRRPMISHNSLTKLLNYIWLRLFYMTPLSDNLNIKSKPHVVREPPVIKSQVKHKPAPKGLSDT